VGYRSKVQFIEPGNHTHRFYLICPVALADALELEKGELIGWVIEVRNILALKRLPRPRPNAGGAAVPAETVRFVCGLAAEQPAEADRCQCRSWNNSGICGAINRPTAKINLANRWTQEEME
jgi:hypothetical protein